MGWVKEQHGVEVSLSTASNWFHDMGFSYKQFSKGLYFDGHERDDVVETRKSYLDTLQGYSSIGQTVPDSKSPCHPRFGSQKYKEIETPGISGIMPLRRFEELFRCLHITNKCRVASLDTTSCSR